MNNKGQFTVEAILVIVILMSMGVGMTGLFKRQWETTKCTALTYQHARNQLIQSKQKVVLQKSCGEIQATVVLLPLEQMKSNGMPGLPDAYSKTKLALSMVWQQFLSLQASLPEPEL